MDTVKKKLAFDMCYLQMGWTLWYIPIVLIGYLVILPILGNFTDISETDLNFMSFLLQPSRIYMAIIGIITYSALFPFFVKQGVTRKQYFVGSALAAAGVALGINIVSALITGILQIVSRLTPYAPGQGHMAFLENFSSWHVPLLTFSLIILTYYIAGWIIGIGFYRSSWAGAGSIIVALVYVYLLDLLWEGQLSLNITSSLNITFPNQIFSLSLVGNLILIGLGLWVIRIATKDVPIKVK